MAEGSLTDLNVTVDGDYNLFTKVLINDVELDSSKYTVAEGSTIVTLLKSYLNTLSPGTYKMKTLFNNSKVVESTFIIKAKTLSNPSTGDNIDKHIALGIISILGLSGTLIFKKRFN